VLRSIEFHINKIHLPYETHSIQESAMLLYEFAMKQIDLFLTSFCSHTVVALLC